MTNGQAWSKKIEGSEKKADTAPVAATPAAPIPFAGKGAHNIDVSEINDLLSKPQEISNAPQGIDVLVFGDTDVGKTFFGMTFPEPIFIIDTEKRADKTKKYHYPNKDVRVFDPIVIKDDYVDDEDAIDYPSSIDNITNFMVALNKKMQSGEITQGTVVVDSLTDIWTWIQHWGKERLAKKGRIDKELLTIKNQFDWGVPNGKNARLMALMKHVTSKGINFVGTSREAKTPDYVEQKSSKVGLPTEKIRTQKDVPFIFSTILHLRIQRAKTPSGFQVKYMADAIKLDTLDYSKESIENINYKKLDDLIKEAGKAAKEKAGK